MLFSNPRVLPALLIIIGLGILIIRGQEMDQLQAWNPDDLDVAVELNYALDLARLGPDAATPPPAEAEQRKAAIREEIIRTFVEPQQRLQTEYRQAQWMIGIGGALMIVVLILQQRGILRK